MSKGSKLPLLVEEKKEEERISLLFESSM